MSKTLDRLTSFFEEFNESPQGDDSQHRLDLAEIMWRGLRRNGWTQRRLARKSGLADADISNLLHGNKNFTSSTYGKVVNALGVKTKTQEVMYLGDGGQEPNWRVHPATEGNEFQFTSKESTFTFKESTSGTTQKVEIAASAKVC